MNTYHTKMMSHIYPFLEREWLDTGAAYSDYLEYDEIILELVRDVRKRTTPGSSRLVQMSCLYKFEPLARAIARFVETPDWPIEYQLNRVWEEHGREVSE